jgi:Family of unknown function (DUF5990)
MTTQEQQVTIEITCTNPFDAAWPGAAGTLCLGIQQGNEVQELTPVNRKRLVFKPVLRVRRHTDGSANFLGPFAHGPRTERFIYLNWVVVNDGVFSAAPGRIKVHLSQIRWSHVETAVRAGKSIKLTVAISKADGKLVFASVRVDSH